MKKGREYPSQRRKISGEIPERSFRQFESCAPCGNGPNQNPERKQDKHSLSCAQVNC